MTLTAEVHTRERKPIDRVPEAAAFTIITLISDSSSMVFLPLSKLLLGLRMGRTHNPKLLRVAEPGMSHKLLLGLMASYMLIAIVALHPIAPFPLV